jgi:translation initiation factor IF-2
LSNWRLAFVIAHECRVAFIRLSSQGGLWIQCIPPATFMQRWLSTSLKPSPHQNRTPTPRSESAARTPGPDPALPLSTGPARGSPVLAGPTNPPGLIPWAPDLRRQTPAAATALAPDTDPGTDPHTPGTGTRTSHTTPCAVSVSSMSTRGSFSSSADRGGNNGGYRGGGGGGGGSGGRGPHRGRPWPRW